MMAEAGQMSAQTPQPLQTTSSILATPPALSQASPGHWKTRVQRRLQPQLSPRHLSLSTRIR